MFILLKLSRICYFRVEKSERQTEIFIIIRRVIAKMNFTILFRDFPQNYFGWIMLQTLVITNVLCEFSEDINKPLGEHI